MKKIFCIVLLCSLVSFFGSACNVKHSSNSMIKSQRRFAKYIEPQKEERKGGTIDLSEGQKLRYEADFGPRTPSFEFKIVNPY